MMLKSFITFLSEAKTIHATTGHLDHSEALLYSDPRLAFRHLRNVADRFEGKTPEGRVSHKVDGGVSVVLARMPNGDPAVGYKTGDLFTSQKQIENYAEETGKPHYTRIYSPLLKMVSQMKSLKKGTAIQSDVVHQSETPTTKESVGQPNTIFYKIRKGIKLVVAAHSQYRVNTKGVLTKTSSQPDVKMLTHPEIHAPELAMRDNIKLSLRPDRQKAIRTAIKTSETALTPKLESFAKSIRTLNPKFTAFFDQYHSHASRTSGVRSLEGLRDYIDLQDPKDPKIIGFMRKSAQTKLKPESQLSLRKLLHSIIDTHAKNLTSLFGIHNTLIGAKHHVLDQMREHEGDLELQTHNGEEHEGMVSSLGTPGTDESQAKFVREGPAGFPKKNNDNPRFPAK